MKKSNSNKGLQLAALAVVLVTSVVWAANGAHFGWTQTSVVEMKIDEITGIEYPVRRDDFVAGVEVLGAGFLLAAALSAAGLLPLVWRKVRS